MLLGSRVVEIFTGHPVPKSVCLEPVGTKIYLNNNAWGWGWWYWCGGFVVFKLWGIFKDRFSLSSSNFKLFVL